MLFKLKTIKKIEIINIKFKNLRTYLKHLFVRMTIF